METDAPFSPSHSAASGEKMESDEGKNVDSYMHWDKDIQVNKQPEETMKKITLFMTLVWKKCSAILLVFLCVMLIGCAAGVGVSSAPAASPEEILPSMATLDLSHPKDSMAFLEMALSKIELERGIKPNSILNYSKEYSVKSTKNGGDDFSVLRVESGPGSQICIIVNAKTKDYRYFDISKDFELLGFDDFQARFTCQSGTTALRFPNFPYSATYRFDEKQWDKVHLPINVDYVHYKLGGNPNSFGVFDTVTVTDTKAKITFNFDELLKDESLGSCLPILHYWFDPITNQTTLSFSGISFADANIIKRLGQLPGITNAKMIATEAIDLDAKAGGTSNATQITFHVAPEYNLYGEYDNTDWDPAAIKNNKMSFRLWTEKK